MHGRQVKGIRKARVSPALFAISGVLTLMSCGLSECPGLMHEEMAESGVSGTVVLTPQTRPSPREGLIRDGGPGRSDAREAPGAGMPALGPGATGETAYGSGPRPANTWASTTAATPATIGSRAHRAKHDLTPGG